MSGKGKSRKVKSKGKRRLKKAASGRSDAVRVCARFRPENSIEKSKGQRFDLQVLFHENGKMVEFLTDETPETTSTNSFKDGKLSFHYDHIFGPQTTQAELFDECGKPVVNEFLRGFNGTIFAYGQTGSGKTFSMFGDPHNNQQGIIPRSVDYLFAGLRKKEDVREVTIKLGFLEIYRENIRDLLNPQNANLKIREKPTGEVYVEGLVEEYVTCPDDIMKLLQVGESSRSVSYTDMNAVSSRSHSVIIMTLNQKLHDGTTCESKLNLADLAGSERIKKTHAKGDTLKEAQKINQSLSSLGNCIKALTDRRRTHVPFRDSRLTFLLKDSLGGNCKTTLLVTCTPHSYNIEETISTLQFAKRAKTIKNKAKINKVLSVAELTALVARLERIISKRDARISVLEEKVRRLKAGEEDFDSDIEIMEGMAGMEGEADEEFVGNGAEGPEENSTDVAVEGDVNAAAANQDDNEDNSTLIDPYAKPEEAIEDPASTSGDADLDKLRALRARIEKKAEVVSRSRANTRENIAGNEKLLEYAKLLEAQLSKALDINEEFSAIASEDNTRVINVTTGTERDANASEEEDGSDTEVDEDQYEISIIEESYLEDDEKEADVGTDEEKHATPEKPPRPNSRKCKKSACNSHPFRDRRFCLQHLEMAAPSPHLLQAISNKNSSVATRKASGEDEKKEAGLSDSEKDILINQLRRQNSRLQRRVDDLQSTWEAHVALVMKNKEFLSQLSDQAQGPRIVKPVKPELIPLETKTHNTVSKVFDTLKSGFKDRAAIEERMALLQDGQQRVVIEGYVFKQAKWTGKWNRRYVVLRTWQKTTTVAESPSGSSSGSSRSGSVVRRMQAWIDNYEDKGSASRGDEPRGNLVLDENTTAVLTKVSNKDKGTVDGFEIHTSTGNVVRFYIDDSSVNAKPPQVWVQSVNGAVQKVAGAVPLAKKKKRMSLMNLFRKPDSDQPRNRSATSMH